MRGLTLGPDYTRARPGHRAVSIRIDCVLVPIYLFLFSYRSKAKARQENIIGFAKIGEASIFYFKHLKASLSDNSDFKEIAVKLFYKLG